MSFGLLLVLSLLILDRDSLYPARGAIVNVSSQAGLMGNPNLPAYVASKHGVIGLSKSVSILYTPSTFVFPDLILNEPQDGQKFAKQLIRVNALCPGSVNHVEYKSYPTNMRIVLSKHLCWVKCPAERRAKGERQKEI
jgi:NAD(P)-dependent dehydrogenase (short-subunit alcohol dehydrogenase family)